MLFVVQFVSQRPDQANLGDRVFAVGNAKRLAKVIAQDREPFLFKDPLTSRPGREVFVQHLGGDPLEGWIAMSAYAPDAPKEVRCILRWDRPTQEFRDPCGQQTFPADGTGLITYPAKVEGGGDDAKVIVDLRTPNP
jgi:hypothetical protein